MDQSTAASRHQTLPDAGRWVDVSRLLDDVEAARERPFYRYTSLGPVPPLRPRSTRYRSRDKRNSTPVALPPKARHGTENAYKRHQCRCDPCTDFIRDARRQQRASAA